MKKWNELTIKGKNKRINMFITDFKENWTTEFGERMWINYFYYNLLTEIDYAKDNLLYNEQYTVAQQYAEFIIDLKEYVNKEIYYKYFS